MVNISGRVVMLYIALCGVMCFRTNQSSITAARLKRLVQCLIPGRLALSWSLKWQSWNSLIASGRSGAPGVLRRLLTLFLPLPPCRESRALPNSVQLCALQTVTVPFGSWMRVPDKNFYTWAGALVRIHRVMRKKAHPSPQRLEIRLSVHLIYKSDFLALL